jgi:hypothetical protein
MLGSFLQQTSSSVSADSAMRLLALSSLLTRGSEYCPVRIRFFSLRFEFNLVYRCSVSFVSPH